MGVLEINRLTIYEWKIMSKRILKIIPIGGFGEVGKNMLAYEYGEEILVVDAGLMFPDSDMLGIDYIIPDFNYLVKNQKKVRGIVIRMVTRTIPAPSRI